MNTTKVILIIGLIYVSLSYKDTSTRNMMLIMTGLIIICMLDLKEGYCTLDSSLQLDRANHRCIGKTSDGERDSTKDSECSLLSEAACTDNTNCHYIPAGNQSITTSQDLKYSILKEYINNEAVNCPSGQYLKNNYIDCNNDSSTINFTEGNHDNLCATYITCEDKHMDGLSKVCSGNIPGYCSANAGGDETTCSGYTQDVCASNQLCLWNPETQCTPAGDETGCESQSPGNCNFQYLGTPTIACPGDRTIFNDLHKDHIYIQNDIAVDERGGFNENCCIDKIQTCREIHTDLVDNQIEDPCNGLELNANNENNIIITESVDQDFNSPELRELFFSSCCGLIDEIENSPTDTTTRNDDDPCDCGHNGNTPLNHYCYPSGIFNEYGFSPKLPSGYQYVKYDGDIDDGMVITTDNWNDPNLVKCNMGYLWNHYCIRPNDTECPDGNEIININNHNPPVEEDPGDDDNPSP